MEVHPEPLTTNIPFSETLSPTDTQTIELIQDAYSLILYLGLKESKSETKNENKPKLSCY